MCDAKKSISCLILTAFLSISGIASAQTVNWMSWTPPSEYPSHYKNLPIDYHYAGSASGSLTLPDTSVVSVEMTGEVLDQSCFSVASVDCPVGFWKQYGWTGYAPGTFTSANVPSLPPNVNLIVQAGYQLTEHTLTFGKSVPNVVMNIISLGSPITPSAYEFTQDFSILSQDSRCKVSTGQYCLVKDGKTLSGKEGSGTIEFLGTYTTISWTVTVPEYYSGFNIGVTSASAVASPTPVPTLSNYTLLLLASALAFLSVRVCRRRWCQVGSAHLCTGA